MESVKPSVVTPSKSKLARAFAKVIHARSVSEIAEVDRLKNAKIDANLKDEEGNMRSESSYKDDEELQKIVAAEALLAKLFASITTVKSSYVQLQYAQSPYYPDEIQVADQLIISELKILPELKRCYLNNQFDPSPERAILASESKELQSVIKTLQ